MHKKILKKDFFRNKGVTAVLFLFILFSAFSISGAMGIITQLSGSLNSLFTASEAPHFVQMHSGTIDKDAIDIFAEEDPWVKQRQIVTMLNINGANIYLGERGISEAGSVMENSFVIQNSQFDYLLDMENHILQVSDGEIGVPVYHMQQYGLKEGDTVEIISEGFTKTFKIVSFIRDAQMNPSIVTSKRFLISENDWNELYEAFGSVEYLIEFQLYDPQLAGDFESRYQAETALPSKDTAITYGLYRLLNSLSSGIVAAVIILIGVLLILIAALCLRFTMIAAIEEDYREIGVMKAIGIKNKEIQKLYLVKYIVLAGSASLLGYVLYLFTGSIFTANMTLYMGKSESSLYNILLPFMGAGLVFMAVVLFCCQILKRFKKISAVEALGAGNAGTMKRKGIKRKLSSSKVLSINYWLGITTVFQQFRTYGVLCLVFIICTFLMIVPMNFYNTVHTPEFITYMGAGKSDIRIDLQQSVDITQRFEEMIKEIEKDNDVLKYASFVTNAYRIRNEEGGYETIKVENGDFSIFPLLYSAGGVPQSSSEIALSVMNAEELGKTVGDEVTLIAGEKEVSLTVCGIYQDVTNGGKTAKGLLPYEKENVLWYVVNLDVAEGVDIQEKAAEYTAKFYPAKVTDMADYVAQTMGSILAQLKTVVYLSVLLGLCITMLITAMFLKMQIAKDRMQIAVMRSMGFSGSHIQKQYSVQAVTVLILGIVTGTILANTVGQGMAGLLLSGVSGFQFMVNPLISYFLCPAALASSVMVAVRIMGVSVKKGGLIRAHLE